jgi:endonuclease/exonuclease/phosphatase family metal-dependent hydrolase
MRYQSLLLMGLALGFSISGASAEPQNLRVMTFNVMCDFCGHNDEIGHLKKRLPGIADTINRHDPDLISVQELRTGRQVRRLQRKLKEKYIALYRRGFFSFADPTLLVRKSRFKVIDHGGFWLGPNSPRFSFGWALAFPRRVEWARLEDLKTGERFTFAGTHFDNNGKNKTPSAKLVVDTFFPSNLPVVFAGDTNLGTTFEGYRTLTGAFRDSYNEVADHPYIANGPTVNSDGCNLEKASVFPDCRIDHVLLSPSSPWRVKKWSVDVFKYARGFVSDHRAIVVDLE